MSQRDDPSGFQPRSPAHQPVPAYSGSQPSAAQPAYEAPSAPIGYQPAAHPANGGPTSQPPVKTRNTIGLIALIVAAVGFIFACIPGALIVGWVLLPIAFILSIVSFFQRGKGKGLGIAALIVSIVGTIVGGIVFAAVIASSFEQAFTDDTAVVVEPSEATTASDGAAAPTEDAAAAPAADGEQGTRESPLPIGTTVSSDEWTVTVDAYNPAGNDIVAGANQFNEPPTAGSHYEIVTYTVTYTGEDSSYALMVGLDLVTSGGNVIDTTQTLAALEDSIGLEELFNGATTSGSTAFLVPDGESVLVRVRPGMLADEMFVQP